MAIPGAAGVESLGGDVASRLGGRSTGFTQFNLLSCQQGMKWFADRMVKVDEEGAQVRAACRRASDAVSLYIFNKVCYKKRKTFSCLDGPPA